jgi:LysR family transcriptional regulator, transcriptional activator of nhaA
MHSGLNFNHLLYFWAVAKEGGVSAAGRRLHVSQPTVSNQIQKLEKALGSRLFDRRGGRMLLTDVGQVVFDHADDIFRRGEELLEVLREGSTEPERHLRVGIVDALPKLVVHRLLLPALATCSDLICLEGKIDELLEQLDRHEVDLVLADATRAARPRSRAHFHRLGRSDATVFGTPELAAKFRDGFPASLGDAPFLLPTPGTRVRERFEIWTESAGIRPRITGQFADSALLKVFGQQGQGLFLAPTVIADEVSRQYAVEALGRLEGVDEEFFAVSGDRRLEHPAVRAIIEQARDQVFHDS